MSANPYRVSKTIWSTSTWAMEIFAGWEKKNKVKQSSTGYPGATLHGMFPFKDDSRDGTVIRHDIRCSLKEGAV